MFKNISTKNKTLLFIFVILTLLMSSILFLIYNQQEHRINNTKEIYLNKIKSSYTNNINIHLKDFYIKKSKLFLTPDIVEAVYKKDRVGLSQLIQTDYEKFKKDDKYIRQLHFHLEDGTTLYRAHKPQSYGDNIANIRQMAAKAHKEQKIISGFDAGKNGLSYRIFIPIFKDKIYIGALELGVSATKLLDIVTYFNKIEALIHIKKSDLQKTAKDIVITNIAKKEIFNLLPKDFDFDGELKINFENKTLFVYQISMEDFEGKMIGEFLFLNDLTKEYNYFYTTLKQVIVIFFVLAILVLVVINYGFSNIIGKLDRSHKELQKTQRRVNEYVTLIDKNVITSSTDLKGNITYVSEAFCEISGFTKEQLVGQNHRIVRHPDMDKKLYNKMWKTIVKDQIWKGEIKNLKKDGSYYWVEASISPIFNDDGKKVGYTAIRQDITDRKNIELISITDALTDIFNRRHFNELFPEFIEKSKRDDELVCLAIMDVDHFKQYNDTYGHQKGDDVLKAIGKTLKESMQRDDEYCFRLGGEEFGVVFKSNDKKKANQFVNTIRESIENLRIEHTGNSASSFVTASFGLVSKKAIDIASDDIIYKEADDMLYMAKESGRNKVSSNMDKEND
jgi:diguanylate cyclase (GGDEF)-like protein/PAS domain S-box-containing protein